METSLIPGPKVCTSTIGSKSHRVNLSLLFFSLRTYRYQRIVFRAFFLCSISHRDRLRPSILQKLSLRVTMAILNIVECLHCMIPRYAVGTPFSAQNS